MFYRHEYSDKLQMLDKVETVLHEKINVRALLGPSTSKKKDYFEAIKPIERPVIDNQLEGLSRAAVLRLKEA